MTRTTTRNVLIAGTIVVFVALSPPTSRIAQAYCKWNWLRVLPNETYIPTDPAFVLVTSNVARTHWAVQTGAVTLRTLVTIGEDSEALVSTADVMLETVDLQILSEHRLYRGGQVIVSPVAPLREGSHYHLSVFDGTSPSRLQTANEHPTETFGNWLVRSECSMPPSWEDGPRTGSVNFRDLGCGPEREIRVHAALRNSFGGLAFLEIFDGKNEETVRAYVDFTSGSVNIGHGMCSGVFAPASRQSYRVRISPVDENLNTVAAEAKVIEVVAPDETEDETADP